MAYTSQDATGLFHSAAFQLLFPKPGVMFGIVVTQVQNLALGLAGPQIIVLGPSNPACPNPSAEPSYPPADEHSHTIQCHL